jgi:RimJ/RimL family protein N-acetyltransferase
MSSLLSRYPRRLEGGLLLRPMQAADETELAGLFSRIPVDERQLFKEDVTRSAVIQGWIRNLDYSNILPLLVFDGSRVVSDATLHRDRKGWSRHVAEIRVALDPDYRGRGLARTLVQEFVDLAPEIGVAILNACVLDVQKDARDLFDDAGFMHQATFPHHAIDLAGRVHDVLVYSLTVVSPGRLAPEASWTEEEAEVGGG